MGEKLVAARFSNLSFYTATMAPTRGYFARKHFTLLTLPHSSTALQNSPTGTKQEDIFRLPRNIVVSDTYVSLVRHYREYAANSLAKRCARGTGNARYGAVSPSSEPVLALFPRLAADPALMMVRENIIVFTRPCGEKLSRATIFHAVEGTRQSWNRILMLYFNGAPRGESNRRVNQKADTLKLN